MNVLKRAFLYDTRKRGKSLTLFLLFTLITIFVTISFSVLETVMEQVKKDVPLQWEDYTLLVDTAEYDAIAYQLSTIGRLTTLLIVSAITVSIIVLFLILAMRIRGRVHEVGVLLAVGVARRHIIAQFFIETTAILLLTFLFSCPVSYFAAMQIGTFLRDMVGAVNIDLSVWKLLLQYGIEVLAVIVGVMIAASPPFQTPNISTTSGEGRSSWSKDGISPRRTITPS